MYEADGVGSSKAANGVFVPYLSEIRSVVGGLAFRRWIFRRRHESRFGNEGSRASGYRYWEYDMDMVIERWLLLLPSEA